MVQSRKRFILFAAFVIPAVIAVLIAELGLRKISGRPYYRSMNEPYIMAGRKFDPEAYGYGKVHSDVFSFDYAIPVDKASDRFKVMFPQRKEKADLKISVLGASVADGVGATSEESAWFTLLEKDLSEALGKRVILERLTMPGIISTQERIIQDLVAFDRNPDAMIILDGFADLGAFFYNARPGDPYDQGFSYQRESSLLFSAGLWLSERSEIANTFWRFYFNRQVTRARAILLERSRTAYVKSVSSVYLDNVRRMMKRCEENHIPCLVFLQPAKALLKKENIADETLAESYLSVQKEFSEAGDPYIDLSKIFQPEQIEVYRDAAHFNDKGQSILAGAMKGHILEMFKK